MLLWLWVLYWGLQHKLWINKHIIITTTVMWPEASLITTARDTQLKVSRGTMCACDNSNQCLCAIVFSPSPHPHSSPHQQPNDALVDLFCPHVLFIPVTCMCRRCDDSSFIFHICVLFLSPTFYWFGLLQWAWSPSCFTFHHPFYFFFFFRFSFPGCLFGGSVRAHTSSHG